jgi:DNA helicase-4
MILCWIRCYQLESIFEQAEERRLLYVALTRTKHAVYVVGDPSAESTFFNELIKNPDVDKSYLGRAINRRCTACQAPMGERNSQHGLFFGCWNYPICEATSRPCIACERGSLVRYGVYICCDNPMCTKGYEACPGCEDGMLVRRAGKNGAFLGGTNYASGQCSYKRNTP